MNATMQVPSRRARHGKANGGQILIEVLIALAILGLIATSFLGAMYTSLQGARITDERSTALTIAKSQIEFVRKQDYATDDWDYSVDTTSADPGNSAPSWWTESNKPPAIPGEYGEYSATVQGISNVDLDGTGGPDEGIRTISVTVYHDSEPVLTLEDYEVDR